MTVRMSEQTAGNRSDVNAPVRIAVAGQRGSGKSSLIDLLVGSGVLTNGGRTDRLPPLILRYSAQEQTIAGWWDRPDQVFPGLALDTALAEKPDIVTVELNCDALRDLWLVDIPPLDGSPAQGEALFALSRLADVMVWCADGRTFADHDDRAIWAKIPAHLRRYSVLALTHMDLMSDAQDDAVRAKLGAENPARFRDCVPVALSVAAKTVEGEAGPVRPYWSDSGAEDLVAAILELTDSFRRTPTTPPAQADPAGVPEDGDATLQTVADPGKDDLPENQGLLALRETWRAKIGSLMVRVSNRTLPDNAAFIGAARDCVAEFLEVLTEPGHLTSREGWIPAEFEQAENFLVLLQFEDAADVAPDAARVLLQLSLCLASE